MNDKKLGWSCSEIIGMAIVNPHGTVAALIQRVFASETGTLMIIGLPVMTGTVEGAALAFANEILDRNIPTNDTGLRIYRNAEDTELIGVRRENGTYVLYYLEPHLFQGDEWVRFKSAVEKICNGLTVFM